MKIQDCSAYANHSVGDNVFKSLKRKRTHYEAHSLLANLLEKYGSQNMNQSLQKQNRLNSMTLYSTKTIYLYFMVRVTKIQQFSYFSTLLSEDGVLSDKKGT